MADTELDDAIASATEEITKDLPKEDKVDDKVDDTTTDDQTNDQQDDSTQDDLNEDQLKEAKLLYKTLLDPQQRLNVVAALAAQSGLLNQNTKLDTPKQVEKVEQAIGDIIREAIPEYPGLADKLGPAIEKIVEGVRAEQQETAEQMNLQQVQNEVDSELSNLARDTKGASRKLENKMASLMQEIAPGPNVTVKSYIRNLYALASAGSTQQRTTQVVADKINRNANNAADRLKTAPGTARTQESLKKMNLNDSVKWAIEQASKGRTKA